MGSGDVAKNSVESAIGGMCTEARQLLDSFGLAVQELLLLHDMQFTAILEGDPEASRFDLLIHLANEKKHNAKYAYMTHLEKHGCSFRNENYTSRSRKNDR